MLMGQMIGNDAGTVSQPSYSVTRIENGYILHVHNNTYPSGVNFVAMTKADLMVLLDKHIAPDPLRVVDE